MRHSFASSLFGVSLLALSVVPAAAAEAAAAAAQPQELPSTESETVDETGGDIVVVATRLRGSVDAPQPPVMTLDEDEIASYGSGSIADLVTALAPQVGSGRGRGDGRPVFLLNGQRISSFREMRNLPPEAIRRLEVLPEEVALRYGFPPNQRVMNFILKDNFASRSVDLEYHMPTRGGFAMAEIDASLLKIDGPSRLSVDIEASDTSLLTEAERGVIQQPGTLPTVAGDPDPARFRSLLADSSELSLNTTWARGLGEGGLDGSLTLNGTVSRDDRRTLSGLDSVLLVAPGGDSARRTFADPLERRTRTDTVQAGITFNKPIDGWQLTVTADASHARSRSRIDRRADTSALVSAAAAGTLPVAGTLPTLADAGIDEARQTDNTATALATLVGRPFRLPAGEASLTVKGGFAYTGIRSTDTRLAGASRTSLDRGDLSAGFNLGLPIASRRENVLAGIGDLTLNLSGGIDRLSDFGTLHDWSAGLTWSPTEKLGLQASWIVNEAAPSLANLGGPVLTTFNVPVFDFVRNETALVTVTTGGNPLLRREKQRDLKLSANWELPFVKNASLLVEYFRNRSDDVTAAFPLLTPEIEAAFPGRVVRDAGGRLVSIDRRAVTFDRTEGSRLRWGFNVSGQIGKAPPGGGDGPRGGGRGMGGGGRGMGPMMGGRGGPGRWNLSLYHTYRFAERVTIAAGGPQLDLLRGDALTGGGVARNSLELEGGAFHKGMGLRFNGSWTAPTRLKTFGSPDLRFGAVFDVDVRAFVNFDQKPGILKALPFLKGSRLALEVENVFDSRQRVTDPGGAVPLAYQPDFLDPRGRVIGIDFRKSF